MLIVICMPYWLIYLRENRSSSHLFYYWNDFYAFIHFFVINDKPLFFLRGHDAMLFELSESSNVLRIQWRIIFIFNFVLLASIYFFVTL